jgi:hypothetical protein
MRPPKPRAITTDEHARHAVLHATDSRPEWPPRRSLPRSSRRTCSRRRSVSERGADGLASTQLEPRVKQRQQRHVGALKCNLPWHDDEVEDGDELPAGRNGTARSRQRFRVLRTRRSGARAGQWPSWNRRGALGSVLHRALQEQKPAGGTHWPRLKPSAPKPTSRVPIRGQRAIRRAAYRCPISSSVSTGATSSIFPTALPFLRGRHKRDGCICGRNVRALRRGPTARETAAPKAACQGLTGPSVRLCGRTLHLPWRAPPASGSCCSGSKQRDPR